MANAKPVLTVLSEDQISEVHRTALTILEKKGVRVDDANAREVFAKAVGREDDNRRFIIPGELIAWSIKSAPAKVDIFRRNEQPAFSLDSGDTHNTIFGIGVTNLYYQQSLTDNVVPFGREHMARSTRLGEGLAEYDTISTPGVIQDVPAEQAELIGSLEMLANTSKPIVLLVSGISAFEASLDMYDHLIGLTAGKPFVVPYLNPITPLVLNAESTIKMDLAIARDLPVLFSNYGMAGATTPITTSGTLALLTAELLAGLVYSQLRKEGTPIILGSLPASFNMTSMESYYSPQSMLLNLACAEMMAHYGVPHCGTSGGWMGWGPDLLAGSMLWANHLTGVLGKVGLVPFVGNNFDSMAFSPATAVYAAEVIRFAREFSAGFSLDADEVGLEEIISLGPGANYLTSVLTMQKFRDQSPLSGIWPTLSLEKWEARDRPKAGRVLREHTHNLLNEITPPADHDRILAAGEEFIAKRIMKGKVIKP
jgi:trimethylamine--corrinoid protein Co-methyltransferase